MHVMGQIDISYPKRPGLDPMGATGSSQLLGHGDLLGEVGGPLAHM